MFRAFVWFFCPLIAETWENNFRKPNSNNIGSRFSCTSHKDRYKFLCTWLFVPLVEVHFWITHKSPVVFWKHFPSFSSIYHSHKLVLTTWKYRMNPVAICFFAL